MFGSKKNSKLNKRRFDSAFSDSVWFSIWGFIVIFQEYISMKNSIIICVIFILTFILSYLLSPSVKEIEVKNLKAKNSLDEVATELYKNDMVMREKIGEYYLFRYRNFFLKKHNVDIFVKEHDKYCVILLPSDEAVWVEESLKKVKK